MKKIALRYLCLVVMALFVFCSVVKAQTMGKQFEVSMTLAEWENVLFPKSAVLSDAKSLKITVTKCNYVKLLDGSNQIEERAWDNDKADAVFNLNGTDLAVAKNGNLYIYVGGNSSNSKVLVTNYDTENGATDDTGASSGDDGTGSIDNPGGDSTGGDSDHTPELGFKDLGKGGLFQQLDLAYSYTGNATTMIAGTVVTITTNSGNLVWYKNKSDYTGYNRGIKSYTLTNDDITSLANNNYTLYFATWDGEEISNITLSSGGGNTSEGGGGSTAGMTLDQKIAAKAQLTDVPTIYLTVPDAEGKLINKVLDEKKEYHTATIQLVDDSGELTEFTDQVMIKVRGNSTAKENKKPYRLKFAKEITDENGTVIANCQKHDMLGKGYSKRNWALLANYLDPAMVRNALTNKIGELVGMPFRPGYKFADVVINGEYRGTYQITDHVEADADRVNVDEKTGWFLESARGDMVEAPSASAQSLMMSIKNPEPKTDTEVATLKTQIEDWFKSVDALFCIYNGTFDLESFTDPVNGWRKYWDEESLVDFYIGINLTGDYDGFMTVKMYRDLNKKLKFGPLWDKDLAFGNYSADKGITLAEDQQIGSYFTSYVKKLWLDPVFIKKVHDKLNTLVSNGIVKTLQDNVDELAELTAKTEELNRPKWGIGASWSQSFATREAAVKQLKDYLGQHIPWFQSTINDRYTELGGNTIVDNSIPGDDFNDGTTPTPGGDDNPQYSLETKLKLGNWQTIQIPASAINQKATSVEITVVGATGVYIQSSESQNDMIYQTWDPKNEEGYTYKLEGTLFDEVKAGKAIYVRAGKQEAQSPFTVTITNIGVPEGGDDSDSDTPAERAQLTNLPTIYLDATVGNEWSGATLEVFDSENKLGQGAAWTKATADVSVQYQGSGDKNKDSYRLKFETKTQLLSSGKFKQWVLLANDDDPTMMRNALAKEMGDALGLPFTPGYQFVDLYVNNTYMGTYQVTDRIKVESGRALVTGGNKDLDWHVRLNDADEYNEDKPTYYIAGTTSMPYIIPKNPDPKDDPTTWNSTLKSDMTTYFNNVFTADAGKYTAFAENVDKQQLIQWYIAQEMLGVYKGFSSVEAYRSVAAADQNLHIGILWDSEKAFGNTGEAPAISMADLNKASSYDGLMTNYAAYDVMKNIFTQLWQERWFANGVNNLWKEKHEAMLTAMTSKATALKTELEGSWALNATQWNITGEQATSFNAMTAWLTERDAYLTKKFADLAAAVPCENHTYANHNYIEQPNGTYLIGCDVCGTIKEGSETYYKFTVYPESAEPTEIIATSWQPSAEHPNSIALVEASRKIVEKIEGYNIICGKKTLFPDGEKYLTCKDFRLTDGHPYYSDNKFIATKATYTRPLSENEKYGMMTLPFKHQNAENEDAGFYHIYKVEGDKIYLVAIDPSIEGNSSAYLPVIFKRKAGKSSVTVTGTDITVKKTSADKFNSTFEGWTITGAVENASVTASDGNYLYEMADSKPGTIANVESLTIAPFRAYLSTTATAPSAPLTLIFPDGEELEVSLSSLVNAIEKLKTGEATIEDIKDIVNKLLGK